MKIVIDTNVVISGTFFKGNPRRILEAVVEKRFDVFATTEIIEEYQEIVDEMIDRKQGSIDHHVLDHFISKLNIIESESDIKICRDPDDDKFINCAVDSKALYIVSGDKDLLVLERYDNIQIVTAKEFCDAYLSE